MSSDLNDFFWFFQRPFSKNQITFDIQITDSAFSTKNEKFRISEELSFSELYMLTKRKLTLFYNI